MIAKILPNTTTIRHAWVDYIRGSAVVLMIAYHFCYDLDYYRLADFDFYQGEFWITSRTVIVSLFLSVMGASLVLATRPGLRWRAILGRWLKIGAGAALVSLSSYLLFRERFIFFGILHFILLASIIGLLFTRLYWINLLAGAGLVWLGTQWQSTVFNHPFLQWFGLMSYKPPTEDYVPFLPWFGVVLLGMFMMQSVLRQPRIMIRVQQHRAWGAGTALQKIGQHSLIIYLVHQPVLLALLFPFA